MTPGGPKAPRPCGARRQPLTCFEKQKHFPVRLPASCIHKPKGCGIRTGHFKINTVLIILLLNFFLCSILIAFLRFAIIFYICFIVIFLIMIFQIRASNSKYENLISGSEKHIIVCPVCHTINEAPEIGVVFHCSKCNLEMKYGHSN